MNFLQFNHSIEVQNDVTGLLGVFCFLFNWITGFTCSARALFSAFQREGSSIRCFFYYFADEARSTYVIIIIIIWPQRVVSVILLMIRFNCRCFISNVKQLIECRLGLLWTREKQKNRYNFHSLCCHWFKWF